MIAAPPLLLLALLGPPDDAEPRSESVRVVAITASPEPEAEPEPEPTAPLELAPRAPEPEPEPARTWQFELFADIAYVVNSNLPDNHVTRGFVTIPRSGEITPNMVGAFIRHPVNDAEPWWFELGIHAGPAVDALVAAEPTPGGAESRYAGVEVFKHIALANVGVRIRKSKTSIGAGVFESPIGLSSFWAYRNPNITPMWQGNATPYYLAGARVSQAIPGGLTLSGWVVNGFQTYADANKAPSGLISLAYDHPEPREHLQALGLTTNLYVGPEGPSIAPEDWLIVSDTLITWQLNSRFAMAGVWDVGIENPGRTKADQKLYTGGGLLARGTLVERERVRLELVVRPDVIWDREGRFLGVSQWLLSGTASANLWLWDHLLLRTEYRFDQSTAAAGFFYRGAATSDGGPGLVQHQHSVLFSLTGIWDFWFGRHAKPN